MTEKVNVTVVLPSGESKKAILPANVSVEKIIKGLVDKLKLKTTDSNGRPLTYRLDHKESGKRLDNSKTLSEQGVKDGHTLNIEATIVPGRN